MPLADILQSYADIIVGMHFGHDHSDSFKVVPNKAGKYFNLYNDLSCESEYICTSLLNLKVLS